LWPPVPVERKVALSDDVLPNGIAVPQGTIITWSLHAMGRMKEFWDRPMEFLPERWLDSSHNPAFMPFLLGPRTCLGQAMVNTSLAPFIFFAFFFFRKNSFLTFFLSFFFSFSGLFASQDCDVPLVSKFHFQARS
jgi:hypothetical protein